LRSNQTSTTRKSQASSGISFNADATPASAFFCAPHKYLAGERLKSSRLLYKTGQTNFKEDFSVKKSLSIIAFAAFVLAINGVLLLTNHGQSAVRLPSVLSMI
jgi:hypothetical protein